MTINVETETVITLGEGCREFPPHGISTATMARLIQKGIKVKSLNTVVKLETLVICGRRCTSREAISRLIAAQNVDDVPAAPVITASQRQRQSEAAQEALGKMGVSRTIALPTKDFFATTGVAKQ